MTRGLRGQDAIVSFAAILTLGFFLGMRHATDPDHVVAVSTIVARERSLRAGAPIGVLWGLGHTITILVLGAAILVFDVVIPARLGLAMELAVAFMLVLLGALNLRGVLARAPLDAVAPAATATARTYGGASWSSTSLRPLAVGVVHGLAGSAAVALLVLGTIHDAPWGIVYLLVFGVGTVAGMLLITAAMAASVVAAARRFQRFNEILVVLTGVASIAFGAYLVYRIGVVDGLFAGTARWTPE
jgi:high-affinity nickel-transport protein